VQRLTTVPSIGPITATAFVAALDDVHRFAGPRGRRRSPVTWVWRHASTAPASNSTGGG
jgi:hypothetical protein